MSRKTKAEAEETRNQILDAAEQCFYEKGVGQTTLGQIADAAKVSRGAIYWHFQNKGDVFQALLERIKRPIEALMDAHERQEQEDPLGNIRLIMTWLLQRLATDARTRRIHEILFHKCEYTNDLCGFRQQMQASHCDVDQRIEQKLINAVRLQQLPADLDTFYAARYMHACIDGIMAHWLLAPHEFDLEAEAERMVDSLLEQLKLCPSMYKRSLSDYT